MKKETLGVPLAAAMTTGLLAGCGSGDKAAETTAPAMTTKAESDETTTGTAAPEGGKKYDGVKLTYWSMWTSQRPQRQTPMQTVEAFETETGARVRFKWRGRETKNILPSALEAQEKFGMSEDDYTRISKNYVSYVADLIVMAEETGYADKSYSVFNSQATEWVRFLPYATEQPFVGDVSYSKDTFDDCGIIAPKTQTEFMIACQTMKDKGYQPLTLDSTYTPSLFDYHLSGHIGQVAMKELITSGGWNSNPDVAKVDQEMIDFVKAGYPVDGVPDEYPASQNKIGLADRVGMVICVNYITSEVNTSTGSEINWGLFAYPTVDGGANNSSTFVGANSIGITKYNENQQAAFDFVLYLAGGKQGQNLTDLSLSVPANSSNTVPAVQNGTAEVLVNTTAPLSWNMGLNANADRISAIQEVIAKPYEGSYATGNGFVEALDALYQRMLENRRRRFMRHLIWPER